MNHARSNDDVLLDRLRAGVGGEVEADPRLPLVRTLVRAAAEPPPPSLERRHLAAISEAFLELGDAKVRPSSNGRPLAGETFARGVPRVRSGGRLKLAALAVATAVALTGVAFATGAVHVPLRAALEEVGLLPEDSADDPRVAPRLPVATTSRRGPKSRCAPTGDASPSATPAGCATPRAGKRGPAPSRGRARRSDRGGRSRPGEPSTRRREDRRESAPSPLSRREAGDSAPGRSGSSPSRRGSAPVGGGRGRSSAGRGRSSAGRSGGSARGRSSSARGGDHSRARRPARPRARGAPGRGAATRGWGRPSPRS